MGQPLKQEALGSEAQDVLAPAAALPLFAQAPSGPVESVPWLKTVTVTVFEILSFVLLDACGSTSFIEYGFEMVCGCSEMPRSKDKLLTWTKLKLLNEIMKWYFFKLFELTQCFKKVDHECPSCRCSLLKPRN